MIPNKQYTPEDIVRIAWRRKWWAIVPVVLVASATVLYVRRLPNVYRSDTLILVVPQRVPTDYVRSTNTVRIEDRLQTISQQIMSRTRLERIIQDFNLYPEARRTAIMEDIVERMRGDVGGVQIVRGDAFRVGFTSNDPRLAMKVAERLASLFIEENLRDREVLAEGTNQFLEAQVEEARRRLVENEKKLEEYRRLYGAELPTQLEANVQALHNVQTQIQSLVDSASRDRDRRLLVERAIVEADAADAAAPSAAAAAPPPPAPATTENGIPAGGTAADRLRAAEEVRKQMALRLAPEHPDYIRMKRIVADLQKKADEEALEAPVSAPNAPMSAAEAARRRRRAELNAELENIDRQLAARQTEEKRLRGVAAEYQARIEATPRHESEMLELTRDYGTLQGMYRNMLGKKEDSKVSANLERRQIGEQFKILDPARVPERPSSPNRSRLHAIGLGAGVALGLALAALIEYLDKTLKSEADITAALNLMVLAVVPILRGTQELKWRRRRFVALSACVGLASVLSVAALAWRLLN